MLAVPRVAPARSMWAAIGQIGATARAELIMQWRRLGLWVAFGCVTLLLCLLTVPSAAYLLHPPATSLYAREHYTQADLINLMTFSTTTYAAMFLGLVAALLVVDRLARDQRLGAAELLGATPQGEAPYLVGKVLGNYVAILGPSLIIYLLCALVSLPFGWPIALILKFLFAFLLVFVPGSLAGIGLALFLASFLPVRVVQVGFALLWIEFSIGPGWHTLVFTIFNIGGLYVYPIFFPMPPMPYTDPGFQTSLPLAWLNIGVLLLTGAAALGLTYVSLRLQRLRQEGA